MSKNFTFIENQEIIKYHKKKMPKTIYKLKKKVSLLIFEKMCESNCDINNNYKHFLSILYKQKMISPNNKNRYANTIKRCKSSEKFVNYLYM